MIKQCLVCSKTFEVNPARIKKGGGKFCSVKCRAKWDGKNRLGENSPRWKGGKIKKNCLVCGKDFRVHPYQIKQGYGKYCSGNCFHSAISGKYKGEKHHRWRGGEITKTCLVCGKTFEIKPCIIKRGRGKFCSLSCNGIWSVSHQKKKHTGIEIKVEQYLKKLGIVFESQTVIPEGKTVADFYIPEQRLIIQADGTYWHSSQKVKDRDQKQDFLLGMNGYKVLRLGEDEINNGKFSRKINKGLN